MIGRGRLTLLTQANAIIIIIIHKVFTIINDTTMKNFHQTDNKKAISQARGWPWSSDFFM